MLLSTLKQQGVFSWAINFSQLGDSGTWESNQALKILGSRNFFSMTSRSQKSLPRSNFLDIWAALCRGREFHRSTLPSALGLSSFALFNRRHIGIASPFIHPGLTTWLNHLASPHKHIVHIITILFYKMTFHNIKNVVCRDEIKKPQRLFCNAPILRV